MTRRPAVTLMEVLVAMFIMAIGMLALLALFPVGAVSMAQALKDDRCAYASIVSENVAIATNVRYGDSYVDWALNNILNQIVSKSGLVYVDPYGVAASLSPNTPYGPNLCAGIPRIAPTFVYSPPPPPGQPMPGSLPSTGLIDRWFSLPDDVGYNLSGTSDTSNTGGGIDRGRRYTYAYLLRRQPSLASSIQSPKYAVQLFAVVYNGRPVSSFTQETTLAAAGALGTNSITISQVGTTIKRGGWILDTSILNPATGQVNGNFYRVTNLTEVGTNTTIEVQQNLTAPVSQITIMDYVAEVFDKGFGWQQ